MVTITVSNEVLPAETCLGTLSGEPHLSPNVADALSHRVPLEVVLARASQSTLCRRVDRWFGGHNTVRTTRLKGRRIVMFDDNPRGSAPRVESPAVS